MKKFTAILFAAIFCLNTAAIAGNIAIIDVEDVLKNSLVMKDIQNKVTKKQDEYQKDVNKKQSALEAEEKALNSKKSVLSKEALDTEAKNFEKKVIALKEFVDQKQNILKKASLESMNKVNEKIKEIITQISKEKDLDLILPASQVLYYKDEMDISETVLKSLNKKITKSDIRFE
jgi:outer membrane protein